MLAWLVDDWLDAGPPVGFVKGFAGTGKSQVARGLVVQSRALGWRALLVLAQESKSNTAEDLALDLAQKMCELGDDAMVVALDADGCCSSPTGPSTTACPRAAGACATSTR
jgi:hypothetical protein